jgi:hypothetical protein
MAAKDPGVNHPVPRARVITAVLTTSDTMNAVDVSDLEGITIQAFGGSVQIDASNDNTNFVQLSATLAPNSAGPMVAGMQFLAPGFCPKWLRVSAVTVGTVTLTITGQKRQSNI